MFRFKALLPVRIVDKGWRVISGILHLSRQKAFEILQ